MSIVKHPQVKEATIDRIKLAIESNDCDALSDFTPRQIHACEKKYPDLTDYAYLYWGTLSIGFTMAWLEWHLGTDEALEAERKQNPNLDVPTREWLEEINASGDFDRKIGNGSFFQFI